MTLDKYFDLEADWSTPMVDTTVSPKQHAISECGTWRHYWSVKKQRLVEYQRFCKYPDTCSICRQRMQAQSKERLDNLYGKPVIIVNLEDEKKFKKDKTSNQYLRIPMRNGQVAIIMDKRDDWDGEVQWLKDDLIEQLSIEAVPTKGKGRISGKLDEQQQVIEEKDPLEPQMLIAYREFEVDWNDKLKDARRLEAIVLDRFDMQHGMKRNLDNLQTVVYQLEQITEQVIKEKGCEGFHFLQRTLTNIRYSEVEWNLWPNVPD